METEICPDCGVELAVGSGAGHPYIGASPSCWELYSYLLVGTPVTASTPLRALLNDAYCVQHHGISTKPQAVQSVAVHLLTLYGALSMNHGSPGWIRTRLTRVGNRPNFHWLTPPPDNQEITILDIVEADSPQARTQVLEQYVKMIHNNWVAQHTAQLDDWWHRFVVGGRG